MTHGDNTQQTREHTAHNIKADKIRKREALEGFYRRLETARGKYTLSNTKRKYKAARHSKQAYNSRLTIQARHQNRTITDFSGFQKYQNSVKNINIPIFEKLLMCVSFSQF